MLSGLKEHSSRLLDPLELRVTPRVGVDIAVDLYSTDISGSLPGRTRDISIEGACIATASPFAIKSVQKVVLTLSGGPVAIDAVGSWQRDSDNEDVIHTGLQFEDPTPEALDAVWSLIFASGRNLARFLYENTRIHELGAEDALGLAQLSRYREIPVGRFIFRQDTRVPGEDSLFVVLEGAVVLQARVRDALEVEIERIGVGEMFGGAPLLADVPHFESAVAATPVRLLEIDADAFNHLRLTRPWLGYRLSQALFRLSTQRLHRLFARLRDEL